MTAPSIFVSIAAYRELELPQTLSSLFSMADNAASLRICICWQRDADDTLGEWEKHPQVTLIDIPYQESRGVCWARYLIQQQYADESYFLQLDGHHRFAAGWDSDLLGMHENLRARGVERPVLTTYLPSYVPQNDPAGRSDELWLLGADRFDESGVVFMRPYIPLEDPREPVPTRFWSAHFSFSAGQFVRDVPIDPNGYFHGEEISTCLRAWTSGYDFFCPHRTLAWHEYSREGRRCHWDDHEDWSQRNHSAIKRYADLVGLDDSQPREFEAYGLGTLRSLADYELYSGISFARRSIAPETLANATPQMRTVGASEELAMALGSSPGRSLADQVPKRSLGWTEEQLDGELVLYNADFTKACYLNDTAALVWHLVNDTRPAGEMIELLESAYEEATEIARDVDKVLDRLCTNGAISY